MLNKNIVSVVASGWSVRDIDLERLPGIIIGVNETALHLPKADHIVTMDRLFCENRFAQVERLWQIDPGVRPLKFWVRGSAFQNIKREAHWIKVFENDHQTGSMSMSDGRLNGSSSGMCAVNLAFQLQPQVVYLFGFDMQPGRNGEPYWHAPHPWAKPSGGTSSGRFADWRRHFDETAEDFKTEGIAVYNVNTRSALECFPVLTPRQIGVAK